MHKIFTALLMVALFGQKVHDSVQDAQIKQLRETIVTLTAERTHNDAGGYIEACGDLPGMVGDDC